VHIQADPRVIMHTPEPRDGAAKYVAQLVVALAQASVPVVLFCPANFEYSGMVRAAGVEIVPAPQRDVSPAGLARRLTRNFTFMARAAMTQFRAVKRGDIVHFQNPLHLPLGFVFYGLVLLRGGSIVLTAHDPMPHRWRLPRILRWLERGMLQLQYRICAAIVVHNQRGSEVLLQDFGQRPGRVFIVPHGPDSQASPVATYPEFDSLRLLAFGAIRQNKGFDLAIDAIEKLAGKTSVPVYLTIAGRLANPAEEPYWLECKERISRNTAFIEVIERFIDNDEITPLMSRHHAIVLPYRDFFSESGVAAQALSHGRPLLATSAGGLRELMEQGACGVVIEAPTPDAVAAAISTAIDLGPGRLQEMGLSGAMFLQSNRSWDSIALQTKRIYSVLAEKTTPQQ